MQQFISAFPYFQNHLFFWLEFFFMSKTGQIWSSGHSFHVWQNFGPVWRLFLLFGIESGLHTWTCSFSMASYKSIDKSVLSVLLLINIAFYILLWAGIGPRWWIVAWGEVANRSNVSILMYQLENVHFTSNCILALSAVVYVLFICTYSLSMW